MPDLIRHADAGDKQHWVGPDDARPLSFPGQLEAQGLLGRLRDYPITRILTSPAVRYQQTVAALSQRRAVPIELADALAVDAPAAGLLALVADPRLQTAVLCTHGELIGQLMADALHYIPSRAALLVDVIRGKHNIRALRQAYPTAPTATLRRPTWRSGAIAAALFVATEDWQAQDGEGDLRGLIDRALDAMLAGALTSRSPPAPRATGG